MSSSTKPFYLQPPWIILFQLHKLQKLQPWGVNISLLLNSFLEEMTKRDEVDFRASGVALDSSATIYLKKSGLLLQLEDPPSPPKSQPDFLPPPLFYPLRYELTTTTLKNLLEALETAISGKQTFPVQPHLKTILPHPSEIIPQIDLYLMEIETKMVELHNLIIKLAGERKLIVFSEIIANLKKIEAIKTFITLLFLAQKGNVALWQEEETCEIYITPKEAPVVGKQRSDLDWAR